MSESSSYAAASAAASAEGSAAPAIAIVSRDWLWRWGVLAILAAGGVFYAVGRRLRNPRMSRLLLSAADFFLSMIQLLIFFPLAVVLSYLFTSLDLPLQDGVFLRLDALSGFDWTAVAAWVRDHALLTEVMAFAYFSLFTQNQIVLFLGSGDRPGDTNGDFIWPAMISAVLCAAIAGVVPALGHQGFIGPAPIRPSSTSAPAPGRRSTSMRPRASSPSLPITPRSPSSLPTRCAGSPGPSPSWRPSMRW